MKDQDKIWVYRVFVILATAALAFGIWTHLPIAISTKIAQTKAHFPANVTLTQHLRPSTYVFSDGSRINIGGWETAGAFVGFITIAVAVSFLWWVLSGIFPHLHHLAFPKNDKRNT